MHRGVAPEGARLLNGERPPTWSYPGRSPFLVPHSLLASPSPCTSTSRCVSLPVEAKGGDMTGRRQPEAEIDGRQTLTAAVAVVLDMG
jgi:hypothetical protein